jgi:hypothetical protein
MLEFDDIQYILLTRVPALTGRYEFLSFQQPAQGRAWLEAMQEKVPSAKAVVDTVNLEKRWVSVAFTWNGLRALGVDEVSLATFPEEFRQGMAARWQVLGDTGTNHPDNWVGGLGGRRLHAIAILFARDAAERERSVREHRALLARTPGVEVLSSLDLEAIPFRYVVEHFGYRDRLTTPEIEGTGIEPTPGSGPPIKAGEFILGYPDEDGPAPNLPQPEILSRNGSYMAYRRLQQHVGAFRDFLRMNPRDTAVNIQRRKMLRRGATYGPPLPEGASEDGVERGIAAFVICASLVRQFEFAQNVWVNDPNFHELGNERDPMIGAQDGSYDITIPKRPIRRKIKGLPAFTTVKGGAYFFLPGIKALRYLAALGG